MKNVFCFLVFLFFTLPLSAAQEMPSSTQVCFPNGEILGHKADESLPLVEKISANSEAAVFPVAVQVLMMRSRCVSVTATYLMSQVSYADVKAGLVLRLGRPADAENSNTAYWTLDHKAPPVTVSVSFQAKRINVIFAEKPREITGNE